MRISNPGKILKCEIIHDKNSDKLKNTVWTQHNKLEFVEKKWLYGNNAARKGVIDEIEHSVAIKVYCK